MTAFELVIGASAAIVMALGFLVVSYVLAWRLCRTCDTLTRWVGVVALLAWLPTALFHLLASRHAFSRLVALAAIVLLVAVTWRATGGAAFLRHGLHRDRAYLRRIAARCRRSPYRIAFVAFIVCALPPVLRAVILPPLGWDTLTYHSVKAAMWVQAGGAERMNGIGPWAYYRNLPGGAEVFLAWAMLPTASDVFTGLLDVMEWFAVGFSVMVLARRVGVREPFASTAACFVLAIPTVRLMLGSSYTELCLLFTCLSGLALGLAADRSRPGALMLAGAALGVSAAVKFPMILVTGVSLLVLALRFMRHGPQARGRWVVAAVAAYGVALVPWLVTATVNSGAPFSPVPIALGPLVLGIAPPELTWYMNRGLAPGFHIASEMSTLRDVFSSPLSRFEGAGLLSLIPIAGMWIGVASLWRRRTFAAVLLLIVAFGCVAGYYSPAFAVVRHYWSVNSSRFLLPALATATVMSMCWCRRRSLTGRLFWLLMVACALWNLVLDAFVGFSRVSAYASAGVFAALMILGAGFYGISTVGRTTARRSLAVCVAILAAVALQQSRDALRPYLLETDYALHEFGMWRYWSPAVAAIDDPDAKYRIAITSGPKQENDHWFGYFFLGRRLQNDLVYVPVSGDGRKRSFGGGGLNEELVRTANFWAWHLRLRQLRITHVISFWPASLELEWMEHNPDGFERIEGSDGFWGLFRVKA